MTARPPLEARAAEHTKPPATGPWSSAAEGWRNSWRPRLIASLLLLGVLLPGAPARASDALGAPTLVQATAAAGSATVSFTPAAGPPATTFTVVSRPDGVRASGDRSPITVVGLAAHRPYSFTVTASNDHGVSDPSAASNTVTPTGPVTNVAPLAPDRTFVNQSVSFYSHTAGTASSRRPTTTDTERPSNGVPAGREWRLLWLRATNCEHGTRDMVFYTYDTTRARTTGLFVEGRDSTSTPWASVPVAVPAGDTLGWTTDATAPLILPAGHAIGVRWTGMTGDGGRCNWQYGAIEQPAGTSTTSVTTTLTAPTEATTGKTFTANVTGTRTSWQTVPLGQLWIPRAITATNCEASALDVELLLIGPGLLHHGGLAPAATSPNGIAQVLTGPGRQLRWNADNANDHVVLPPGWSLGVRWHDMTATTPDAQCSWSASVGKLSTTKLSAATLDAVLAPTSSTITDARAKANKHAWHQKSAALPTRSQRNRRSLRAAPTRGVP